MKVRTLTLALLLAGLSACNTVAGIGKDLGAVGDALTGASRDAQSSNNKDLCGAPGSNSRNC